MTCIILIHCAADGRSTSLDGEYLVGYEDAGDHVGLVATTAEISDAKLFANLTEAVEFWKQQSVLCPIRPDGKPNRPLTAFTIEVIPVDR